MSSLSLSTSSSPLETLDMNSSSESIVLGVGGAGWGPAEPSILLLGATSFSVAEDVVASAAFRFLVVGGIVEGGARLVVGDDEHTRSGEWGRKGVQKKEEEKREATTKGWPIQCLVAPGLGATVRRVAGEARARVGRMTPDAGSGRGLKRSHEDGAQRARLS
jgi:hypothetical protein